MGSQPSTPRTQKTQDFLEPRVFKTGRSLSLTSNDSNCYTVNDEPEVTVEKHVYTVEEWTLPNDNCLPSAPPFLSRGVTEIEFEQNTEKAKTLSLQESKKSVEDILIDLRGHIEDRWNDSTLRIDMRDVWGSAVQIFTDRSFNPKLKIRAAFIDEYGMDGLAVDEGGPRRECLTVIMRYLRDSVLFEGSQDEKYLTLNSTALRDGLYEMGGKMIAVSLVHGGPAPHFFSRPLCEALLYFPDKVNLTLDDILDYDVKTQLEKIQSASTVAELTDVVGESADFLSLAGCLRVVQRLRDKDSILHDAIHWYIFGRCHTAFEKFQLGLETLGVLEALKTNPLHFRPILCGGGHIKLILADFDPLFKIKHSSTATVEYAGELQTVEFWMQFLADAADSQIELSLEEILCFATGLESVPPLGFDEQPYITFDHEAVLPRATVCSNTIHLPVLQTYREFVEKMLCGIKNSPGFGLR